MALGEKNDLGFLLVADFAFDNFVGAIFKSLVVGVFAIDAAGAIENALHLVD